MNKGGAPSGQRTATQKRLRDKEEEKNPDAKTQREEDVKEAKRNFFSRHTARQSLPNIDVFRRSIGKWGGSFAEVFFIKCPHHR
jgi:hypothetical protein